MTQKFLRPTNVFGKKRSTDTTSDTMESGYNSHRESKSTSKISIKILFNLLFGVKTGGLTFICLKVLFNPCIVRIFVSKISMTTMTRFLIVDTETEFG